VAALSPTLVEYLSSLRYEPDAERLESILPIGGIYWADELDFVSMKTLSDDDRDTMFRVVALRMKIWDGDTLGDDDQQFWDAARSLVPEWALFRRLSLSDADRRAHQHAFSQVVEFFETLKAEGYDIDLSSQDGTIGVKATKNLGGNALTRWWRRLAH
jgi:hypothetical protein